MKKCFALVLSMMLLLTVLFGSAYAEDFELRGIKFGMTLEQIKDIETLPYSHKEENHDTYYFKGTISGIDNSQIGYSFENGVLKSIVIDFDNTKSKLLLEQDYNRINSALITKYGTPLGLTGGKTYQFVGNNMKAMSMAFQFASLVNMSYDYSEWWIETDGGYVKIDQVYSFMPGKKGSENTALNSIDYTYFSDEEVNAIMGDL